VLYSIFFIPLVQFVFFVASFVNSKVRRGYEGRKTLFADLEKRISKISEGPRVWFHASSLGEFEQAKPVIEILKRSGHKIIVSFFSPSGYEHSMNYPNADVITYIPLDSKRNAEKFIDLVRPRVVVVMRYDLWMNHLLAARESGAKIFVADATFPSKLLRRVKLLKVFYRQIYGIVDLILATSSENKRLFDSFLGKEMTIVAGDTRFDRVYSRSISNNVVQTMPVKIDKSKRVVLILGSTWRQDIDIVCTGIERLSREFPSLFVLIVPHEPTSEEVGKLKAQFSNAKVLSETEGFSADDAPILIVDRVGILTQLYVLADIAYVGGGFGAGVHSVLEPAVYGVPIITGPRIERSAEAMQLMQDGALFFIKDSATAYETMSKLVGDEPAREKAGRIAKAFVDMNIGASAVVAEQIMKFCSA
jgi:3-deoxy-D-manno-octulosonic-acid transferase